MGTGTVQQALDIARAEIGYSRWADTQEGTKYGRWYAEQMNAPYFGKNGVPYCAMFTSWVLAKAGVPCAGLPAAYVPAILNATRAAGVLLKDKRQARAGDLVIFNWDGGLADHIGLVERNEGTHLVTIEGNTSTGDSGSQSNGGRVARRTRQWATVEAIARPSYKATPVVTIKPSTALEVDGWIGAKTVTRLQQLAGTPADGVISGQCREWQASMPAVTSVTWTREGSQLIAAVQRLLHVEHDGIMGEKTVKAWQKRLGVEADGILGRVTGRAIQERANQGSL